MTSRRGRPTMRCLVDDLDIELPPLNVDLGELDHPFLRELRRIAATSPQGQKRILSIAHPLVYRLRVSNERGATWLDDSKAIVWLCAAQRREDDSDDDAYQYFAQLHANGALLPNADDDLRDRAEVALRLHRLLTTDLISLVDQALAHVGDELRADLGDLLPCRVLVLEADGLQEIWCALSVRATNGDHVRDNVRDLLFAELEQHLSPAATESRRDWPGGAVDWFEIVVLSVR